MRLAPGSPRRAGVIGWPVAHSRSPKLHGAWLKRYGIEGTYEAIAVRPDELAVKIRELAAAGFAGLNVTLPHKEQVLAICDRVEDQASRIGAVNTLVFGDGITGSNTDGYGFTENLRAHGVQPGAGPALILGAGGAARAIAVALQDAGASVTLCNRTPERAETLAAQLPGAKTLDWARRAEALGDFALLVNTTSLGMVNHAPLEMQLGRANAKLVVSDIVYTPLETTLLADAKAHGLQAVEGLGMLLHQAVPGFTAWFGTAPVVDEELYRIVAGA
jgi:shikimate dehydrogenase